MHGTRKKKKWRRVRPDELATFVTGRRGMERSDADVSGVRREGDQDCGGGGMPGLYKEEALPAEAGAVPEEGDPIPKREPAGIPVINGTGADFSCQVEKETGPRRSPILGQSGD